MSSPTLDRPRRHALRARTAGALCLAGLALAAPAGAQGAFVANGEQSMPAFEVGEATVDWYWWWHFNKDAFLRLRERVFEVAPKTGTQDFFLGNGERIVERDPSELSAYELRVLSVPAILSSLEHDPGDQLIQAALFSLAKIGPRGELSEGDSFHEIISDYLDHTSKAVRERAVVALGILGSLDSVPTLVDLLHDSPAGRRLVGRSEVEREMRSYAAYALGMIGARSESHDVRRGILAEIVPVLDGPKFATRDIKTACITAVGLMPLEVREWQPKPGWKDGKRPPPPDPLSSRQGQIRYLLEYLGDWRRNLDAIRSQAPVAMIRLLDGADPRTRDEVTEAMMRVVRLHTTERDIVQQGAVIALGELADADDERRDRKIVETLIRLVDKGDQQARRYALISLGRIAARPGTGGEPFGNQDRILVFLRRQLEGRGESRMRAWAALSLGVMMHRLAELRLPLPEEPAEAMRKALEDCVTPLDIGAYALAVGLMKDLESLEVLISKLSVFQVDTARGLVLLAMGMTQHRDAVEPLLEELRDTSFRGERMAFASIGLALAGSAERIPVLIEMLKQAGSQASQGPIVAAMGVTGDRRVIYPLAAVARDTDTYSEDVRTAAVVGLGNVADKDKLLWRAQLSANANYRGTPPTLLRQGSGILTFY